MLKYTTAILSLLNLVQCLIRIFYFTAWRNLLENNLAHSLFLSVPRIFWRIVKVLKKYCRLLCCPAVWNVAVQYVYGPGPVADLSIKTMGEDQSGWKSHHDHADLGKHACSIAIRHCRSLEIISNEITSHCPVMMSIKLWVALVMGIPSMGNLGMRTH